MRCVPYHTEPAFTGCHTSPLWAMCAVLPSTCTQRRRAGEVWHPARRGGAASLRGSGGGGFTLIELMVAVGLVAMVLVAMSSLTWQVTGARARVQRLSVHHAEADAALSAVVEPLRDGFRNVGEDVPVFEGTDEELDGRPADRLRFWTVSERVFRPGQAESDVHEVEFWLEAVPNSPWPALLRRTDPTRNAEPDRGGVVERVAQNVAALDVSYFDGTAWVPDWPEYLGAWPEAVRVRVAVVRDPEAPAEEAAVRTYSRLVYWPLRPEAEHGAGEGEAPEAATESGGGEP